MVTLYSLVLLDLFVSDSSMVVILTRWKFTLLIPQLLSRQLPYIHSRQHKEFNKPPLPSPVSSLIDHLLGFENCYLTL